MFVAGTSTHKVGEVAQTLLGVAPSASMISRLNQSLTQQFEVWRQRPLQPPWHVLYLDGVHFSIRHGDKADSTIILTALAVDLEGNKEVLADRACAEEGKDGRVSLLQDLRARGATRTSRLGPGRFSPAGMQSLHLQVDPDKSPTTTTKAASLSELAAQFTIGAFQ